MARRQSTIVLACTVVIGGVNGFAFTQPQMASLQLRAMRQRQPTKIRLSPLRMSAVASTAATAATATPTTDGGSTSHLRIGLFGGGTVGGGVVEILAGKKDAFQQMGCELEVVKLCVRDVSRKRDFAVGEKTSVVSDYDAILDDPSINCVVELMGGVTNAKDVVFRAIRAGKHVVTANKALVSQFLPELQELLRENPGVHFAYEAAVCGGIPIIHALQSAYVGDRIKILRGILNGTTNFMLSKMEAEGADYAAVLKEAQDLGFAEADPTADVGGFDVQAKIALLAKLAFGATVPVDSVPCDGITRVEKVDFEYAKMLKSTIKLLGTAMVSGSANERLSVFVSPVMVPLKHPIASARGAGNIVALDSANLGSSSFAGPGAGRFPTANSVVSDLVRLAQGRSSPPFPYDRQWDTEPDFTSAFYTRITCADGLGIIKRVGEVAEINGVSIHAIHQNPIEDPEKIDFVITTDPCKLSQIESFTTSIGKEKWAKQQPMAMPML